MEGADRHGRPGPSSTPGRRSRPRRRQVLDRRRRSPAGAGLSTATEPLAGRAPQGRGERELVPRSSPVACHGAPAHPDDQAGHGTRRPARIGRGCRRPVRPITARRRRSPDRWPRALTAGCRPPHGRRRRGLGPGSARTEHPARLAVGSPSWRRRRRRRLVGLRLRCSRCSPRDPGVHVRHRAGRHMVRSASELRFAPSSHTLHEMGQGPARRRCRSVGP